MLSEYSDLEIQETREGPNSGQFRSFPYNPFTFPELPTLYSDYTCTPAAHRAMWQVWLRKCEQGVMVLEGGWDFHRQARGRCKERALQAESAWMAYGGQQVALCVRSLEWACIGKGDDSRSML